MDSYEILEKIIFGQYILIADDNQIDEVIVMNPHLSLFKSTEGQYLSVSGVLIRKSLDKQIKNNLKKKYFYQIYKNQTKLKIKNFRQFFTKIFIFSRFVLLYQNGILKWQSMRNAIILRLIQMESINHQKLVIDFKEDFRSLNINDIIISHYIYLIGILLSIIIFLLEVLYFITRFCLKHKFN
jgi:hypothetical protein